MFNALLAPIKKPRGKSAFGNHLAKIVDREPKLMQMIEKCQEPLIGLQYVTEFCHISPEFEPVYACNLCESKCDVRMIIKHLTGFKHRFSYLKKHHVNYAVLTQNSTRKSDQTAVAETYAAEIETKEGRQKMVVRLETSFTNGSGLESSEQVARSPSSRSGSSGDHREFRKRRRRSRSHDYHRRHESSRYSQSPDRHRHRRRHSSERRDRDYSHRRERDYPGYEGHGRNRHDYYRHERDRRRPGFELSAPFYQYPVQYPLNQAFQYGMNAAPVPPGYAYSPAALPSGVAAPPAMLRQYSEYRASLSVTNPSGFSNLISYPPPRAAYGGAAGFQPAPQMVPPVMPPTEAAKMSPYYQIPYGSSTSTYGVANANTDYKNSLPFSRTGSMTLSSIVSNVSANVAEDNEEANAISKVIAEAILKYKVQKGQAKTANANMFSNRY